MPALPRSHRVAGILGLLLGWTAAAARATPAEEYVIEMSIAVHPGAGGAPPAETAARVDAMLDEATRIMEGVDADPPSDYACPIRFRALNIHRYDPAPDPPFGCGTGTRFEAA